jgi:hypothetical protein
MIGIYAKRIKSRILKNIADLLYINMVNIYIKNQI